MDKIEAWAKKRAAGWLAKLAVREGFKLLATSAAGVAVIAAAAAFLADPVGWVGVAILFSVAFGLAACGFVIGRPEPEVPAPPHVEIVEKTANIDVVATAAGAVVSSYLSLVNFANAPVRVDLTEGRVGSAVGNLATRAVTLPPRSIVRVGLSADTTEAGGSAVRGMRWADVNGYLTIEGQDRRGFTVTRVPINDGGVRGSP